MSNTSFKALALTFLVLVAAGVAIELANGAIRKARANAAMKANSTTTG